MDLESILTVMRSIGALLLVIYLINILIRYLSKFTSGQNRLVRIIEKVPLDANLSIVIIEVMGDFFLVSSSKESTTILRELDSDEVEEQIEKIEEERKKSKSKFEFLNFLKGKSDHE